MAIDFSTSWVETLNQHGKAQKPCYFIIDFTGENGHVFSEKENSDVIFDFSEKSKKNLKPLGIYPKPIDEKNFFKAYKIVQNALQRGDSYLANLTFSTPLEINYSLKEIFETSRAKYKILFKDKWVCFSPETFISTRENKIFTFPMKGTINAEIPQAKEKLIQNLKELAEHFTIVDLLRNDLNLISKEVKVNKFRYLEEIKTQKGSIYQASSEIEGKLPQNWQNQMGEMLQKLLPAGSISGAPKPKTLEIIHSAETHQRGFYTGIAGHFDGKNLNTAVMIRFIEKIDGQFFYKSGGGITAQSIAKEEYQEIQDKIYIPR